MRPLKQKLRFGVRVLVCVCVCVFSNYTNFVGIVVYIIDLWHNTNITSLHLQLKRALGNEIVI